MKIQVVVKAGSSKNNISKEGDIYTIRLRSKPIKNSANIELINLLSKYFGISNTSIKILRGLKSKTILIEIGMKIETRKGVSFNIDFILFTPIILLCIIGIISLLSTTITVDGTFGELSIVYKQIVFVLFGLLTYILLSKVDISLLRMWQIALPIYLGTIALLILVLIFGPVVNNVQRWLVIGGIQIQPSK